jgi:hypothetical protein
MAFIAAAIIGGVAMGGASYLSGRSARKAQNSQNDANAAIAAEANAMEMERYYQSRGAAMGATYDELTARPGSSNYNEDLSMFNPDGSAKKSAVLPLYLSELEGEMAEDYQSSYGGLKESYDGMGEFNRVQQIRQGLAPSEQGYLQAVNNVYDGTELAEGRGYLDTILNTREQGIGGVNSAQVAGLQGKSDARFTGAQAMGDARLTGADLSAGARMMGLDEVQQARLSASQAEAQAILNEGQRNAARQDFTGRSGIIGQSANSLARMQEVNMQALARAGINAANNRTLNAQDAADVYEANALDLGTAYLDNATDANRVFLNNATDADLIATGTAKRLANAREQDAVSDMALYEQNLANRKDGAQISGALNTVSNNATAGLNTVYAGQDATNRSIRNAGMQIGQGRTPEVSVPSYTAPVKESFLGSAMQGISGGVSTYLMANAMFPNGMGGGTGTAPKGMTTTLSRGV